MRKTLSLGFIIALVWLLVPVLGWTQPQDYLYDHRLPGDRAITLDLGTNIPLFFQHFDNGSTSSTNLTLGALLGIDIEFYMTGNFKLGGELKGMAAAGPNNNLLFMVPLTLKADYEFNVFPFTFPVGLGAGVCFTNYLSATNIEPLLMPSAGAYWNVNSNWSVGLNLAYWMDFQLYFGNPIPSSESRLGHFLETSLSAIYHF